MAEPLVWFISAIASSQPGKRGLVSTHRPVEDILAASGGGTDGWFPHNGRVHPVPDRRRAVTRMIRAWVTSQVARVTTVDPGGLDPHRHHS